MKREITRNIDLKLEQYDAIKLKQMDSTTITFKIIDNGIKIDLSKLIARLIFTKPNGKIVIQNCEINNNLVVANLLEDCVRHAGSAKIEVELKEDVETVSSFFVPIKIESTAKENVQSENTPNYIEFLEQAGIKSAEATEKANTAAKNADEKATKAEESTILANETIQNANTVIQNAENAIEDVRVAKEEAEKATQNAIEATEATNTAVSNANLATEATNTARENIETKWEEIQAKYEEQEATDVRMEVIAARGGFENLKARLDNTDSMKANINDMSTALTGTNITAQTKSGMGKINIANGFTKEEGTGVKSLDNIHTIKCLADDVNLFDSANNPLKSGLWDAGVGTIKTNSQGWYVVIPITGGQAYTVSKKYTKAEESLITFCLATTELEPSNNVAIIDAWRSQATSKVMTINTSKNARYLFVGLAAAPTLTDDQKRKAVEELKIQQGSVATPYSQYGYGTVEIISKNGEQQVSNIVQAKPLYDGDVLVRTNKKVVRTKFGVNLDGTETWQMDTSSSYNRRYFFTGSKSIDTIVKANTFPVSTIAETLTVDNELLNKTKTYIRISGNKNICIYTENFANVAELTNYLKSSNVTVVCEREAVIEEAIDCSNKIQQFDGETTFYNRDNAEIEVSVTNNIAVAEIYENIDRVEKENVDLIKQLEVVDFSSQITLESGFSITANRCSIIKKQNRVILNCHLAINTEKAANTLFKIATIPHSIKPFRNIGGGCCVDNGMNTQLQGSFIVDGDGNILVSANSSSARRFFISACWDL